MAINKAIFEGRLTADPELRHSDAGRSYCRFSVAVDDSYRDTKKTYFLDVVAGEKTAEFITRYGRKGSRVLVEAKATQKTYTDRAGNNRSSIEFASQNVTLIDWPEKKTDPLDDFSDTNEQLPF